jgi:hypothetical protein
VAHRTNNKDDRLAVGNKSREFKWIKETRAGFEAENRGANGEVVRDRVANDFQEGLGGLCCPHFHFMEKLHCTGSYGEGGDERRSRGRRGTVKSAFKAIKQNGQEQRVNRAPLPPLAPMRPAKRLNVRGILVDGDTSMRTLFVVSM